MIGMTGMKSVSCLFVCAMLTGCLASRQHCVVNKGQGMLSDVTVTCGSRSFNHGYLVPGAHKSYSGSLKLAKGDVVTVGWTGQDNTHHTVPVALPRHPGSRQVVFRLENDDVEVVYGEVGPVP